MNATKDPNDTQAQPGVGSNADDAASRAVDPDAAPRRWRHVLLDFWFAPVRAERLLLFQRLFTATFFLYLLGWTSHAGEWLTTDGFHLSARATSRAYPAPFPALPPSWLAPFLIFLFGTTVAVFLDVGGRLAKGLLCTLAVYVQMVDQPSSFTLNKMYVVFFFFLTIAPSVVTASDGSRWQAAWGVRFIQATLVIQYGTAGVCKAAWGDWLTNPQVLYTHTVGIYRTPIAAYVVEYTPYFLWVLFAWSALLFELCAPIVFTWRRTRFFACLWGSSFHVGVAVLMKDLIFFSQQMMTTYVLFLKDEWVVRAESWFIRYTDPIAAPVHRTCAALPGPIRRLLGRDG